MQNPDRGRRSWKTVRPESKHTLVAQQKKKVLYSLVVKWPVSVLCKFKTYMVFFTSPFPCINWPAINSPSSHIDPVNLTLHAKFHHSTWMKTGKNSQFLYLELSMTKNKKSSKFLATFKNDSQPQPSSSIILSTIPSHPVQYPQLPPDCRMV